MVTSRTDRNEEEEGEDLNQRLLISWPKIKKVKSDKLRNQNAKIKIC